MAPSAIAEHAVEGVQSKVVVPKPIEIIPIPKPEAKGKARRFEDHRETKPAFPFSKAVLLDENRFKSGSRGLRLVVSILLHVTVIAVPILIGVFFTDTINIKQYAAAMLVAPPPPPPPATGEVIRAVARLRFISSGKLLAPTVIPKQIAEIKEAPLEPESDGGVVGGVPGGVPGGQMGGVIGGVLGGVLSTAAKPVAAPAAVKSAPIRVGGRVKPPRVIFQVPPAYPPLARQARIEGQVQIDAVLDENGNVVEMKVVSGPPLLHQAALEALRKWKYEPTYLNDQPIAVQLIVTVTFVLSH
jgi:periplasmic protein TonB